MTERHALVSDIQQDLSSLGVRQGDHVLVTAAGRFMKLPSDGNQRMDAAGLLLDALLASVGDSGTIVALPFTSAAWTGYGRRKLPVYDRSTPPTTGRFAAAVAAHPDAHRSTHPMNSFAAIGARASELVKFHTPWSHSFRPIEDLVDWHGKMLLVGTVDVSPGFSSVHLAQHHLGLSTQNLTSGRLSTRFRDPWGRVQVFHKRDIPGCSMGFNKMYPLYRKAQIVSEGTVAHAPAMLGDLADAYDVDIATLLTDPLFVLCDNPQCSNCRASLTYNRRDWVPYWRARRDWSRVVATVTGLDPEKSK